MSAPGAPPGLQIPPNVQQALQQFLTLPLMPLIALQQAMQNNQGGQPPII